MEILLQYHFVEAKLLGEDFGYRGGVVHRVLQRPELVVGVADDQRNAPCFCRACLQADKNAPNYRYQTNEALHDALLPESTSTTKVTRIMPYPVTPTKPATSQPIGGRSLGLAVRTNPLFTGRRVRRFTLIL